GCGGHYMGVFERHWLDIPPTQHAVFMRYHEFFRIEGDRVVEMQAVWDIPQVMIQADAWPMSPALGMAWQVPAPAPQNGLKHGPHDTETSATAYQVVFDMLTSILRSSEGVDAMQLDRYWHPKMNWYGPAGIGSMRRITGFRNWHQIPFLKAMPDRAADLNTGYMFADDDIVAFTAWPGAQLTLTQDGWLGIPPLNKPLTMRSLDFWRVENGMIRENWVLVDLLDMYNQMGVDVFSRMCEVTVARQPRGSFTI
ncbi:MAG: ester cyclase, partial [Chloroflexota bacterium]